MLNKYTRLRVKVATLLEDIAFLRKCKRLKVFPNFVKIKSSIENNRTQKSVEGAKTEWLKLEIKHKYGELAQCELELYHTHLEFTRSFDNGVRTDRVVDSLHCMWIERETMFVKQVQSAVNQKRKTHKRKLSKIISESKKIISPPEYVDNFVINESNELFDNDELNLLNRGLKFTPKPTKLTVFETIVDIESTLKFELPSVQNGIRKKAFEVIESARGTPISFVSAHEQMQIIKRLKEKNVVYVKADKGNQVVILDKTDYENRVLQLISECGYKKMKRNPLKTMVRECDTMRQKIRKVFCDRVCRNLIVPNPVMPEMYALPKTHKPGNKMRPIVSNINAPSYKMAKWLLSEVKQLPKLNSCSVKDSFEFVEHVSKYTIKEDLSSA